MPLSGEHPIFLIPFSRNTSILFEENVPMIKIRSKSGQMLKANFRRTSSFTASNLRFLSRRHYFQFECGGFRRKTIQQRRNLKSIYEKLRADFPRKYHSFSEQTSDCWWILSLKFQEDRDSLIFGFCWLYEAIQLLERENSKWCGTHWGK